MELSMPDQILLLLKREGGLTDREITDRLKGRSIGQQPVNSTCRRLASKGKIRRQARDDGLIGNWLVDRAPAAGQLPVVPTSEISQSNLSEDEVKHALAQWLRVSGWTVEVAWHKTHGPDLDARRGSERWLIEVKGAGSREQMRANYFLNVLGEILQEMRYEEAAYSVAFPDMQQYRRLWKRLPKLAKHRLGLSALFVSSTGNVEME